MAHGKHLCSAFVADVSSVEDAPLEPCRAEAALARVGDPCVFIRISYSVVPPNRTMTWDEVEGSIEQVKRSLAAMGLRLGGPLDATPRHAAALPTPFGNLPQGPIEVVDPETGEWLVASAWNAWEMSVPVAGFDLYVAGRVEAFLHLKGKQVELFVLAEGESGEQVDSTGPNSTPGRGS
jgi:hypothetical protein